MDWLFEKAESFFNDVIADIVEFLTEKLAAGINFCRSFGDTTFSGLVGRSLQVLSQSPEEWNADGWSFVIQTVNELFVAFGCSLVVVFFLIGFITESIDPRHDVRIETIMKALFKILLAEWLVCYSADIITMTFGFVRDLTAFKVPEATVPIYDEVGKVIGERYAMPAWKVIGADGLPVNADAVLSNMDIMPLFFTLVFAFLYMLVMLGAGCIIVYTAYMRFFKLMIIVPYGALASSTVAGTGALSQTAMHYYKYVLSTVLEAVTIIIAIALFSKIMAGNQFNFIDVKELNFTIDYYFLAAFLNRALAGILLLGAVKGAGVLTQKLLGA